LLAGELVFNGMSIHRRTPFWVLRGHESFCQLKVWKKDHQLTLIYRRR